MASTGSVWGIEIGQSALKALRCKLDGESVVAEAFDYIEYPKILSQPEADAESLVREALDTFVRRNDLLKTKIAVSVAGQTGLAKFFKPPPVELKKIPDIVKYEARQQIPFDLKEVIWDYQLMAGSNVSDGFALESEIGLFAMKRDSVNRALAPLKNASIEVDLLQLAPLSIYNAITYDRQLASDESFEYDSEHPPASVVILAMGTDATDLIVTNGYRVWQRSMPIGGNHFTRQLTKDLKLTFAKAEHLKRNAMEADDPKLVFQAMRPIFNDLVTEVQRSIGFFRNQNKKAEVSSILMLGNSVKLPGLPQYLSKNLGMDVNVLDNFAQLNGGEVVNAAAFKDHLAAFAPVYGLCLEGLAKGPITTNLIPQEVIDERIVKAKKPWAVAAASVLLIGLTSNLWSASSRYAYVKPELWQQAISSSQSVKQTSDTEVQEDSVQTNQVNLLKTIGEELSGNNDRRLLWLELLTALSSALNRPELKDPLNVSPVDLPYNKRKAIHITKIESQYFTTPAMYLTPTTIEEYEADKNTRLDRLGLRKVTDEAAVDPNADPAAMAAASDMSGGADPTAAGGGEALAGNGLWVVELTGYHYHNGREYASQNEEQEDYVLKHLIHELETGSVTLPMPDGTSMDFTYRELGISNPFLVGTGNILPNHSLPNPEFNKLRSTLQTMGTTIESLMGPQPGMGPMGAMAVAPANKAQILAQVGLTEEQFAKIPPFFPAPKFEFRIQFVWKKTPLSERLEARQAAEAAAKAAAESGAAMAGEEA